MNDYILLMHDDAPTGEAAAPAASGEGDDGWAAYLDGLRGSGAFEGGSSVGAGVCVRKRGEAGALSGITGFIRVRAPSLEVALGYLAGNPDYESGATVEVRELPRD